MLWIWNDTAFVPMQEREFFGQQGIFRTMRCEKGEIADLEEHLQRFYQESAHQVSKNALLTPLQGQSGRARLIALEQGERYLSLTPLPPSKAEWRALIVEKKSPPMRVKSLLFAPRFELHQWAVAQGFDEAIEVDARGVILESCMSNVLWELEGEWFTPTPRLPLYWGVTIERLSKERRIHCVEKRFDEIERAQLYLCNALQGIRPLAV